MNPGQNDPEHWQNYLSAGGAIKAEETGKIVVLTDIYGVGAAAALDFYIRKKDAAGAVLLRGYANTGIPLSISFREGLEGDAHDGSNAGDLWAQITAGTITFTGYMRDA